MNKIHPDLLKNVTTLSNCIAECFLYANNLDEVKYVLDFNKIDYKCYPFINCFYAKLSQTQIAYLSKLSSVNFITKEAKVTTFIDRAKQFIKIDNIPLNTPKHSIAFIDTGIMPHLDFLLPYNKIIHFKDLINKRNYPYDDNGHGTFISGVCCGSGICSNWKYSGIAPNSNIVMIKALDKNGETSSQTIIEAMQYINNIKRKYNIRVVCMSFGADYSGTNDPLQKGATALWNNGLVVVCAAGNSGPSNNSIKSPGTSSRIITVGGLDDGRNDGIIKIADFSSRGPVESRFKPDVVAPSVDIISTNYAYKNSFYTKMSGTSVATPIVAGICSRMIAQNPKSNPDKIKYTLLNQCTPLTHNKNDEGFGYIKLT